MTVATAPVADIVAAADGAAPRLRAATRPERARWLRAIADGLDVARAELVAIADAETRLGAGRLDGEVTRTTGQLRMFGSLIEEGSYLEASRDTADPAATPPRPEIRRMLRPLGPVGVFSASNFPFAFSVAGGDTASALAAGCPVVVKAHSGHRELSVRTAEIVTTALEAAGAPDGAFALIEGRQTGIDLVVAPAVRAVSFTGSVSGGRGLLDAIATRPDPIPFFGELGSINPVVITPGALRDRRDAVSAGLTGSFTLGGGQFCTKPGVVFTPAAGRLHESLRDAVDGLAPFPLLTERIADAFAPSVERLLATGVVEVVAGGGAATDGVAAVVVRTTTAGLAAHADVLLEECFGPLTLLVDYDDLADLPASLDRFAGSLTATLHSSPDEAAAIAPLLEHLAEHAGRVVFDGWPTGVAVTWGQHHGGPWPATNTQHTSVGGTAIRRFLRPIAYQNAPEHALPVDLTDAGLAGLAHRVDGELVPAGGRSR